MDEDKKDNINNPKNEEIGLFLNIKVNQEKKDGILFNYTNKDTIKSIITFIDESIYLVLTKEDDIIKIYQHSDIEYGKKGEQIILSIKKDNNSFILKNPMPGINILPTENNVDCLKKKLWYVINSTENKSDKYNNIINEDYYLNENDIIKIGNIIYIVKKINIRKDNNNEIIDEQNSPNSNEEYNIGKINKNSDPIFNFYPSLDFEKCKFYDGKKVKFCQCNEFIEINCLKKSLENTIRRQRSENVGNLKLENRISCQKCRTIFPLTFKVEEKEEDLIDPLELSEKDFNEKHKNKDFNYLILESIYHKEDKSIKRFHFITLSGEDKIYIGSKFIYKNTALVTDSKNSVSRQHAIIENKNGQLLLKNNKGIYGTLVLIKNSLKMKEKKINLQVGKVFIEASLMKKKDFDLIKNENKKYPLENKEDYYINKEKEKEKKDIEGNNNKDDNNQINPIFTESYYNY